MSKDWLPDAPRVTFLTTLLFRGAPAAQAKNETDLLDFLGTSM